MKPNRTYHTPFTRLKEMKHNKIKQKQDILCFHPGIHLVAKVHFLSFPSRLFNQCTGRILSLVYFLVCKFAASIIPHSVKKSFVLNRAYLDTI